MRRTILKILGLFFLLSLVFVFDLNMQKTEDDIPRQIRRSDRGLYVTWYMASSPSALDNIIRQAKKGGFNTLVVDAKPSLQKTFLELATARKLDRATKTVPDPWLAKIAHKLHAEGFILSVRLVTFKDDHLVLARPDLGIKLPGGGLYRDRMGGKWCDPYADEVRLYNELIAETAAISGADEVQFDYIRFPAEGDAHLAYYPFKKEGVSRVEIINAFLRDVRKRIAKYNVSIAVDIFGITAWQSRGDIETLGQDLKKMAKYIDVLSPMFYPSHFHAGYDGYENPGSHPYYFMHAGVKKTLEILSDEAVAVVPWLQGFDLRSPNFGPGYIREQVRACRDAGTNRYLIWNARNDYSTAVQAPEN